eukprot:6070500-Pyramimonas_sp.AAC.1
MHTCVTVRFNSISLQTSVWMLESCAGPGAARGPDPEETDPGPNLDPGPDLDPGHGGTGLTPGHGGT